MIRSLETKSEKFARWAFWILFPMHVIGTFVILVVFVYFEVSEVYGGWLAALIVFLFILATSALRLMKPIDPKAEHQEDLRRIREDGMARLRETEWDGMEFEEKIDD